MSKEKQASLGFSDPEKKDGPVECLGQTFKSDEARREHYLALLKISIEIIQDFLL